MIYLDNAATTRVLPVAVAGAVEAMERNYGNPAAVHGFGKQAKAAVEQARQEVLAALHAKKGKLVFTSGGTESINWAIAYAARKNWHRGCHIVTTAIEHAATLETVKALGLEGFTVTYVEPNRDGSLDADKIIDAVTDQTALVTVMQVCNETGAIIDTKAVAQGVRKKNPHTLVHIDGVQGFMKVDLAAEDYDFVTISAHKIGGMKGVGGLYIGQNIPMKPLLHGGYQDEGLRSGTQPVPQIVAFGKAVVHCGLHPWSNQLRDTLIEGLQALGGTVVQPQMMAPHIVNVGFQKGKSEVLIRVLSDRGIAVSGGSACNGNKKSHVLLAMKCQPKVIESAMRISLCKQNTKEEIDIFLQELKSALEMFK